MADNIKNLEGQSERNCGCAGRRVHADFGTVWDGAPNGIPYVLVSSAQKKVPVSFYYADESDPGPYPIPLAAPVTRVTRPSTSSAFGCQPRLTSCSCSLWVRKMISAASSELMSG